MFNPMQKFSIGFFSVGAVERALYNASNTERSTSDTLYNYIIKDICTKRIKLETYELQAQCTNHAETGFSINFKKHTYTLREVVNSTHCLL